MKGDKWWVFNGEPVTVKFLIRVDDPTLRLPEGRYIADQIEKAGIRVERLEYDRTKCREYWGKSDPIKELPITGEIPSAARIPKGCRFHPRCLKALEACRHHAPLTKVGEGHYAACWLNVPEAERPSPPAQA